MTCVSQISREPDLMRPREGGYRWYVLVGETVEQSRDRQTSSYTKLSVYVPLSHCVPASHLTELFVPLANTCNRGMVVCGEEKDTRQGDVDF